jgi:hypothetical protein
MPSSGRSHLVWQPSRFLTDRAEAERAFQLAERLGSVNAAATQLGTTWPSLRKAFTRPGSACWPATPRRSGGAPSLASATGTTQGAGGLGGLQLDLGPGRMVPRRAHRAGPIAELLGGDSELTRCPRRTGSTGASVSAAVPDGAAALVVRRGGGIEPRLVACLPDADPNKMRAYGHASDLPERTPRDPSLHLTAPYAIPPLNCGNTLQGGAL